MSHFIFLPATGPAGDTDGVVHRLVDDIIPAVRERHNARRAERR